MRQSSLAVPASGAGIARLSLGAAAIAAGIALAACGQDGARSGGPGLSVAVVPPVEPVVQPGETMEVGQLRDGFDRAALERAAVVEDDTYLPPEAYAGAGFIAEPMPRMPMPTPVVVVRTPDPAYRVAVVEARPPPDRLADGSPVFGFDRPRRDYAAERAARWARREAHAASSIPPDSLDRGPVPYTEVVKYSSE
ncbi:MAG: hypothetical protein KKA16_06210 [Alphaproteobacteria bacterium]|nr:hypothetical protein [Alphaproteobacteria bacterium]MBU2378140.1 hypothetical protein [Alphaproteobacteria bacterium]